MVITSYEIIIADSKLLQRWEWAYVVVDEGHRLKNADCRLLRELGTLNTNNKLLLTGQPCRLQILLVMRDQHAGGLPPAAQSWGHRQLQKQAVSHAEQPCRLPTVPLTYS